MSLSLGEKLRQAREERGFTLVEVAEQTRISPLYLESIENDDYRILPGGIFNKGFVKSYAKFVGINENEALEDYSQLIAQTAPPEDSENLKVYRPEVLTDDRPGSSMLPTVILAAVILGLMTAGILFLVSYLRQPQETPTANATPRTNTNTAAEVPSETPTAAPSDVPAMGSVKVEFTALSEPVSLTAVNDTERTSSIVNPGTPVVFEPKEMLRLGYSRSFANLVELKINGKKIALPAQPLIPRRNSIEFEITKDNLQQIWTAGAISPEAPAATPPAEPPAPNTAATPAAAAPSPASTPTTPRPTPARPANTAANRAVNAAPAQTPRTQPQPTRATPAVNRP